MDALEEHREPQEQPRTIRITNLEHFGHADMPVTKELTRTDVIARAKAMGVRDYRDRVVLAIQNDEIRPMLGKLFSRDDVDRWIDAELAVDRYEDQHYLSLALARALAREGGLENYSMAVLNAVTRMEIEGVEYRKNAPRIPREAFEAWLEDQGMPAETDEAELDAAFEALLAKHKPTFGDAVGAVVELFGLPALIILGCLWAAGALFSTL